jgi:hypothetical protein
MKNTEIVQTVYNYLNKNKQHYHCINNFEHRIKKYYSNNKKDKIYLVSVSLKKREVKINSIKFSMIDIELLQKLYKLNILENFDTAKEKKELINIIEKL